MLAQAVRLSTSSALIAQSDSGLFAGFIEGLLVLGVDDLLLGQHVLDGLAVRLRELHALSFSVALFFEQLFFDLGSGELRGVQASGLHEQQSSEHQGCGDSAVGFEFVDDHAQPPFRCPTRCHTM